MSLSLLHEDRMDDTNVEEESSDAAAYGLVALCDQTFEGVNEQCTEEVVETSGQVVAAEINENSSVKIYFQHVAKSAESNAIEEEGGIVINVADNIITEEFESQAAISGSREIKQENEGLEEVSLNMTEENKG